MSPAPNTKFVLTAAVCLGLIQWGAVALANEPTGPRSAPVLCGTLEGMSGEVQMMDSARTRVMNVGPQSGIPCGGWVTVGSAPDSWAVIRHREGQTLHLGAGSFLQVPDNDLDGKGTGDHFILFRGEVFAQNRGSGRELRLVTANARARISHGTLLLVYNAAEEETQMVSLEGAASLENKFQPTRRISAKEGEATSLNFKLLRIVPSTPRAVGLASLRAKLQAFPIDDHVHSEAIRTAYVRQERKFATVLSADGTTGVSGAHAKAKPGIAPQPRKKADRVAETHALQHWNEKHGTTRAPASAGQGRGPGHGHLEVQDGKHGEDSQEKKRLMEELSRIQPD